MFVALFFFIYVPSVPLDPTGNAEDACHEHDEEHEDENDDDDEHDDEHDDDVMMKMMRVAASSSAKMSHGTLTQKMLSRYERPCRNCTFRTKARAYFCEMRAQMQTADTLVVRYSGRGIRELVVSKQIGPAGRWSSASSWTL